MILAAKIIALPGALDFLYGRFAIALLSFFKRNGWGAR
jgi:hypothetical protein